jgi:pimeloyl-ACP methyl ester carboxylesterase
MSSGPALAHDDRGSGRAIVLVHGHPFNRGMWAPQADSLARDFRVVAPDLPGYGASPPRGARITMRELADADPYAPAPVTDQLVASLPAPEVVRLPGVGHLPHLEAPERFDAALRAFVSSVGVKAA